MILLRNILLHSDLHEVNEWPNGILINFSCTNILNKGIKTIVKDIQAALSEA